MGRLRLDYVEDMIASGYSCLCVEEPVVGCTDETACDYNPEATLDTGCDYISCGCDYSAVIVDGGSFQGEVSWTISDAYGTVFASGGAPYAGCVELPTDCYFIDMVDSWGDGWNGNTMTIDGEGNYTLVSGNSGSATAGDCPVLGCTDETSC